MLRFRSIFNNSAKSWEKKIEEPVKQTKVYYEICAVLSIIYDTLAVESLE